jgi:hypothetical protein
MAQAAPLLPSSQQVARALNAITKWRSRVFEYFGLGIAHAQSCTAGWHASAPPAWQVASGLAI